MKKMLVLLACLMAMAISATAQSQLNFANLPLLNSPSPVPAGYGQLTWGNFFYVDPYTWSDAGPGYELGPQVEDVAFIGGQNCRLQGNACYGTLNDLRGFQLISANVAGGYGPAALTVTAYNNGAFVGSANFFVGTSMETLTFPASWGVVTEISIQVNGQADDLVVYSLNLYTLGG